MLWNMQVHWHDVDNGDYRVQSLDNYVELTLHSMENAVEHAGPLAHDVDNGDFLRPAFWPNRSITSYQQKMQSCFNFYLKI
jgi:hypothetical protein